MNKKYTIEIVKQIFEKEQCTCLGNQYKNGRTPLSYICKCGTHSMISLDNFLKGQRCGCGNKRIEYQQVVDLFHQKGCTLLEEVYIGPKIPMRYICVCKSISQITYDKFRRGQRCKNCRDKYFSDKYRSTIVRERRLDWWKKAILNRDKICQVCKSDFSLQAHHLNGFDVYVDQRYDLNNGITLCQSCHNNFHNKYGRGRNTRIQFEEYISNMTTMATNTSCVSSVVGDGVPLP